MRAFQFNTEQIRGIEVMHLTGGLEESNAVNFASALGRLVEARTPRVLLDCRAVTYISSMQLKVLVEHARCARLHGGDVKCFGLSPVIQNVATLIANGDSLDCRATLPDAIAAFDEARSLAVT